MTYNAKVVCTFVVLLHKPRFQTKTWIRAIPSNDVGGDAFLADANAQHSMLGFCSNNFSSIVLIDLIVKFLEFQWRNLSKNVYF